MSILEEKHAVRHRAHRKRNQGLIFFALLTAATYFPIFAGRVPFPRDLVLRHAAWAGARSEPLQQFPEIGDLITSFYPFHAIAGRAWHDGALPLWNPYILAGAPLLGNIQSALLYPFNSLYYILPTSFAWTMCLLLRMFLAAWFMSLLVRAVGASHTGAIFAGVVFATCGFMTAWQGQAMGDAAIWLPMICYGIYQLHMNPTGRSIALLTASFAMPVLAGHPETAFHVTLTGSALALVLWIPLKPPPGKEGAGGGRSGARRFDLRFAIMFAVAGVVAIGLASVQLLPGVEWAAQPGWSYDVVTPALSWHDGQGFFSRDIQQNLNSAGIGVPEAAAYIGMLTLLLAPFSFFHTERRIAAFFALITAVATSVAFSIEPAHWIVTHLPYIKVMKHGRLILIASFGLAALAGLGVSALEKQIDAVRRRTGLAWTLLGATGLLSAISIYKLHLATLSPVPTSRGPAASFVFLCAALGILAWRLAGRAEARTFSLVIIGAICVEMVSFSYGYVGFARPSTIFPAAGAMEFLSAHAEPGVFRFAKAGYPIPPNAGVMYNLESADGYDICLLATRTFCRDLTQDRDDGIFFLPERLVANRDRRLDMLNVKYFLVGSPSPEEHNFETRTDRFARVYRDSSVAVYENRDVLPRLFAVAQTGLKVIGDRAAQLACMKDPAFDPERTVVFGERPSGIVGSASVEITPAIQLIARGANSSRFHVRTTEASVLVLSQIYYKGWKASIDGVETSTYQVDYALTGIVAPAGDHDVRFYFDPSSVKTGAALSAVSLAFMVALGFSRVGARSATARL